MKIKEIVDPEPVTLEGPQIDALKGLFKSGRLSDYLNDRKVIMVGKKVVKHFQKYMKKVTQQKKSTFGLSQKELDAQPSKIQPNVKSKIQTNREITLADGEKYTWKGAQWVSNSTGKIAKKEIAVRLTKMATLESLEKLGKIQLTEEEEQQLIEEVLQELLPGPGIS